MTASFRTKILPAVKTAYVGGFANFGTYAKISWPYVVMIFLLYGFERYYWLIPFFDEYWPRLPSVVYIFLRHFLEAIFIVGFYRFLLLNDTEHLKIIAIKQGIEKTTNLIAIPVYFRVGVREMLTLFIALAYIGLKFLASQSLNYFFFTEGGVAQPTLNHPALYSFVLNVTRYVFFPLFAAVLIFLWPYVATAESLNFGHALRTIKAIRGNIIRVAIISFLIYQPAYFYEEFLIIWSWFHFFILEQTSYSEFWLWLTSSDSLRIFGSLSMLLKYCCLAAEIYFVQSIYRKIVLKEAVGAEAENGVTLASQ